MTRISSIAVCLLVLTGFVILLGLKYLQVQLRAQNQALQQHVAQLAQSGAENPTGAPRPPGLSDARFLNVLFEF